MSLDFYLEDEEAQEECSCTRCDNVHTRTYAPELFGANITHNLTTMAEAANIYHVLWRPDENGFEYAKQIIEPLQMALVLLKNKPEYFHKYNPKNGWGSYEGLVNFVEKLIAACIEYPEAKIRICR